MCRDSGRHSCELRMEEVAVRQIPFQGVLDADREPFRLQLQTARIDPAGSVAQQSTDAARKQALESGVVEGCECSDGFDTSGEEALLRLRAHPRQSPDRERGEETC